MKIGYKTVFASVIGVLLSTIVPAQDLPEFPADRSISRGHLPNGMSYYIVENASAVGMADFALVRKKGFDGDADFRDDVVMMNDVMIAYSPSVMDSTLLSIFTLADAYSPADQAVMVSGDVSAPAVLEKLRMLSYMTPVRDTAARTPYLWKERDSLETIVSGYRDRELATVGVTWYSPRTEPRQMVTVQPAIYSLFVSELGIIATDRMEKCFRQAGIPVAGVSYRHDDSAGTHGDEAFNVSVSVSPEHLDAAVRLLAYVMSSLDSGSATVREVERAREKVLQTMYDKIRRPFKSNSDYIDRCISAFLYNGSLTTDRHIYDFQSGRALDGETELSLFNGIASALLDRERNTVLECRSSSEADPDRIAELFRSAWDMKSALKWSDRPVAADFLQQPSPKARIKIPAPKKEPLSGGAVWTLPEGMTVVSMNIPAERRISYSMMFRCGFADIRGLNAGEGAYIGDYLHTCRIADVPAEDFFSALAAEGIIMDVNVNMTDVEIRGSASKYDLEKVLQAISAILDRRQRDDGAFAYYKGTLPVVAEYMKGSRYARMAEIGSLMCPGSKLSSMKSLPALSEGFADMADGFYDDCFSRTEDAVLVICGDTDDGEVRRLLSVYGQGFASSGKVKGRPAAAFHPVSGVSSGSMRGDESSAELAMSARIPLTTDNYAASLMAELIVKQGLAKEFKGTGWIPSVVSDHSLFPDERYTMVVSLTGKGEEESDPVEAMAMLNAAFSRIASSDVDPAHLEAVRAHVKARAAALDASPEYWAETISRRLVYGKDLHTGFGTKADAVTAQKVRSIISFLDKGGKVEYIVTEE